MLFRSQHHRSAAFRADKICRKARALFQRFFCRRAKCILRHSKIPFMLSLQEETQRPIHKDTRPIFAQMNIAHLHQIAFAVFQNHVVIVVRPIVYSAIDKVAEPGIAHLPGPTGAPVPLHAASQNSVINPHHKFRKIPGWLQTLRTKIGPLCLYLFPVSHSARPLSILWIGLYQPFRPMKRGAFGASLLQNLFGFDISYLYITNSFRF